MTSLSYRLAALVVGAALAAVAPAATTAAASPAATGLRALPTATDATAVEARRDRVSVLGHSSRGAFLTGDSGDRVVSANGTVALEQSRRFADGAYRLCGDMVARSSTFELPHPQKVTWRHLGTGRSGTLPTSDVANYLGPAPTGILYAEQSGSSSDVWLRTTDGVRHRLATVPGFVDGGTARCDTSGVAILTRSGPSPRTGDTDRIVFVRFSGGYTTVAKEPVSASAPLRLVEVSRTCVLWSLGDTPRTKVALRRTDVGVSTRSVVTVPAGTRFAGAGCSPTETLYTTGLDGGRTTRVHADGSRSTLTARTELETSWWPSGSGFAGADARGVWRVSGDTASRTWEPPFVSTVYRSGGRDRYETAAAVQWLTADVVYVASGSTFPDALSGAPAAVARGGTLLLTRPTSLPAPTRSALKDLHPREIVVLGGEQAVSADVLAALRGYAPQVRRVAGADRYATAVAVSGGFVPDGAGGTVVVAAGRTYADALAGGAAASAWRASLLLTDASSLRPSVAAEIERIAPDRVVVLGGPNAVSADVEKDLRTLVGQVTRISGRNRYETADRVSAAAFPSGAPDAHVVSGTNFPDGLVAGAVAGRNGGPVLLTGRTVAASTLAEVRRVKPATITVVGGTSSVSEDAREALQSVWWR